MKKLKKFLLVLPVLAVCLTACGDEIEEEKTKYEIDSTEKIIDIQPKDDGFWGEGIVFIVETDVQTYIVDNFLKIKYHVILNNTADEDRLIKITDTTMDRDYFVCELTKETYKTLSKEYAFETQLTLKKEDISVEKLLKILSE